LTLENEALAWFDRIYVCSDSDHARLAPRSPAQLCLLPNTVQLPLGSVSVRDGVFQFLFVGTLGYPPNDDAVVYFCSEIVPRIEQLTRHDFRVVVAGRGASRQLRRLERPPRIAFAGWVPDLAPLYGAAGAAVVPIRAGGGTRIKVLEAFSYRCPVVTTSQGLAGIDARHDEHVLIGDTTDDFAGCCARLIENAALGRRLAEAAFGLTRRVYSMEAVAAAHAALPPPVRIRGASARQAESESGRT
jgi:glycosyltransferase involved in cell wall biosynthesis